MSVNDYDEDLYEAFRDLVDDGHLVEGTPAYGITKQVIDLGYESLTPKQRFVHDSVVVPALANRERELQTIHHQNMMQAND